MTHQYKEEVPYEIMTENDSKLLNDDHEEKIDLNDTNPIPESQLNNDNLHPILEKVQDLLNVCEAEGAAVFNQVDAAVFTPFLDFTSELATSFRKYFNLD